MENFKIVAQTPLGETAHFGFCPPKISLLSGLGGVPKFFFLLESSYFCDLGAGLQKVGTAGTAGTGQNIFGWTK